MLTLKYERRRGRDKQVLKDNVPQEIIFEILVRLPVKSLLRCRCVCKSWYTLIESSSFVNSHLERNSMKKSRNYLLYHTTKGNSLSLYCPETFSKCLDINPPTDFMYFSVRGSCNGLLCISGVAAEEKTYSLYLWNPSIRKIKRLPESQPLSTLVALGFGFHDGVNDYKVVRVQISQKKFIVDVYSLRLSSWKNIAAVPPVSEQVSAWCPHGGVFLNGFVYWIIGANHCYFILSFDMGSEIFRKIIGLDRLAGDSKFTLQVFEKSLYLIHHRLDNVIDIWVMEADTWKMIRTINLAEGGYVYGAGHLVFRTSGRVHPAIYGLNSTQNYTLHLYDPESHQVKDTGIRHTYSSPIVYSYRESLFLLN